DRRGRPPFDAVTPGGLPPSIGEFVGRQEELERLRKAAHAARAAGAPPVLTIHGQPGTGKSTTALRFAHEMRGRYADAELYIDLKGSGPRPLEPVEALRQLVGALGVAEPEVPTDLDGLTV